MKITIVGAGAIGGYLGARLALAGEDVTFVARGPNLAALRRRRACRLILEDGTVERAPDPIRGVQSMSDAGVQDVRCC
jgi:2-dehydropantoate 2-reductase